MAGLWSIAPENSLVDALENRERRPFATRVKRVDREARMNRAGRWSDPKSPRQSMPRGEKRLRLEASRREVRS